MKYQCYTYRSLLLSYRFLIVSQVNILEDSTVCIEFFKCKEGKERVVEVFRISPDGSSIQVYNPHGKGGCAIGDTPPSPPSHHDVKPYTYENLPQKYWKRYQYAARLEN